MVSNWRQAIDDLERQVKDWTSEDIRVESQTWSEDPTVNVLVFAGENGRRVTLEPASWKRDEVPTAADLYSSRGPRVRLQGPYPDGRWKVLSSDLLPLRIDWSRLGFDGLIHDLLAV